MVRILEELTELPRHVGPYGASKRQFDVTLATGPTPSTGHLHLSPRLTSCECTVIATWSSWYQR